MGMASHGEKETRGRQTPRPDRVIVLGLLAGAWWALLVGERLDAHVYRSDAALLAGPDWDPRERRGTPSPWSGEWAPPPYPRALRQAKGVGRRRSVDLTHYFQVHGRGAPPEGLYGIGETTAAAVNEVLFGLPSGHRGPGHGDPSVSIEPNPPKLVGASQVDG
jgi:hypothetical protein